MAPDCGTTTAFGESNSSDGGADPEEAPSAAAAAADMVAAKSRRNKGYRQNRRRWRLLQYVLGWMEASTLEAGGGGGVVSWIEAEEAWAAAADASVAITCSGPPPGMVAAAGIATNAPGACRRPFLIEINVPPCPFLGTAVATAPAAGSLGPATGADLILEEDLPGNRWGGAIADGVWVGVLDDLGPFYRQGGGSMRPTCESGRGMSRKGRLSVGGASAVWSCEEVGMQKCRGWGEIDFPAYVNFMLPTLRDCGERYSGSYVS